MICLVSSACLHVRCHASQPRGRGGAGASYVQTSSRNRVGRRSLIGTDCLFTFDHFSQAALLPTAPARCVHAAGQDADPGAGPVFGVLCRFALASGRVQGLVINLNAKPVRIAVSVTRRVIARTRAANQKEDADRVILLTSLARLHTRPIA